MKGGADAAAAPDHSDIAGRRGVGEQAAQDLIVVAVAPGDEEDMAA
jgi:hypothetical protein